MDDPIVIDDVSGHIAAIRAEYAYVESKYGLRGVDWDLQKQALLMPEGGEGRKIDELTIRLSTGEIIIIFFDITKFWGMGMYWY